MKVLVTGARGMLGTDLVPALEGGGYEVFATDIEELDITHLDFLRTMTQKITPDIVVNCAAYTKVDKAEEEPEEAFQINSLGVENLSLVCRDLDIDLCHVSTDYVFDGTKEGAYMPDDPPHPINVYGKSKLAGEEHVQKIMNKFYILRTSWLYGKHGKSFVSTILNLAKKQNVLRVVIDQIGSPTWTVTLARAIVNLIQTKKYGLYHVTDKTENGITWFEFAREIVGLSGLKAEVMPVKTEEFSFLAQRPKNSLLNTTMAELVIKENLPPWKQSLEKFLSEF